MQWNAEEADIFATLVSSVEPRAQEIDSVRGMMYGVQSWWWCGVISSELLLPAAWWFARSEKLKCSVSLPAFTQSQ